MTPSEAALGAKIEVPTLSGEKVVLTIPPGTSTGTKLRLRAKGVPDQKTKVRGDQFCAIKIVVPHDLSEDEQQLYRQLSESSRDKPREGLW